MLLRIAFAAALVASAHPAGATEAAKLCRGDAIRFCMDEFPDRGRITACLEQRKADLSAGCRTMFDPPDASPAVQAAG